MLSIAKMAQGQEAYYLDLAREDYYLNGGEAPGYWRGRGAEALLLSGTVRAEHLTNLWNGLSPDGKRPLVQLEAIQEGVERQPGWDLTFSAPKSVSVLWAAGDDAVRRQVEIAHGVAVDAALGYLGDHAAHTRRGKAGRLVERAGLIVACFEHGTSRNQDPQLHTHALAVNVCVRADGSTGTLHTPELYRHKMAAGVIYRTELAATLRQRLGVRVEEGSQGTFEIQDVPTRVRDFFSSRRAEIVREMQTRGLTTARDAERVTLATRQIKGHASREELFAHWQREATRLGFGPAQAHALTREPTSLRGDMGEAVRYAKGQAAQLVKAQGHFAARELVWATSIAGQTRGWDARLVRSAVDRALGDRRIVALGQRYTTRSHYEIEQKLMRSVERLAARADHAVSDKVQQKTLKRFSTLSDEQRQAFLTLTGAVGGSVQTLRGLAGTGKTHLMNAARHAWEQNGFKVIGVSLSAKAARELDKGAKIQSDTIHKTLNRLEPGGRRRAWHVVRQFARAATGKPTYTLDRLTLDNRTILVVDEAAMATTHQVARLAAQAERSGAKLVLVGDDRQLQSIEAGGAFGVIHRRTRGAELVNIARQRTPWMRKAVQQVAEGDVRAALSEYATHKRLRFSDTRDASVDRLVQSWRRNRTRDLAGTLILAGTHAEVTLLNRKAQAARQTLGEIGRIKRQRVSGSWAYENDRILITGNSRVLNVRNGDLGTVERVGLDTLTVRLDDDGRRVTFGSKDYPHLQLGYAVTTHKAQGTTVDKAFVLLGGAGQSREMTYVQLSRARSDTRLFTTEAYAGEDLTALAGAMGQSRRQTMALEHEQQQKQKQQKQQC